MTGLFRRVLNKIIRWLDNIKREENVFTQTLKLLYIIGQKTWIHSIITVLSGIFIPILYERKKWSLFWISIIITIVDVIYAYICNKYQKKLYMQRKFASEVSLEQSSLISSICIYVENNKNWKNTIFKIASDLVCEKIQRHFKEIYNCETRVSVEYVFNKTVSSSSRPEKYIKMSGRRSNHRQTVKKSIPLRKKNKYYSYKIFSQNNKGINILSEEDIRNEEIWYKNSNNPIDVKRYIGIAISVDEDNSVNFILQIDCLEEIVFGENNSEEDIKDVIEQYLMAYINIVRLTYLLNLNKKNEIPEV